MSAGLKDRRRHNFYVVDNEVIDEYIEQVPEGRRADALAVYTVLARHADEHGRAWPGVAYIGRKIGRSRPTVIDAVQELGKLGLVGKEQNKNESGGQMTNTYTLLPVEKGGGVNPVDRGGKQDLRGGVNRIDTKKTQIEKDTPTGQALALPPPAKAWADTSTKEKQQALIRYLDERHVERDLDRPTSRQKSRLAGELRTYINRGTAKADLYFALDKIVEAKRRGQTLELYQALSDDNVRHLRAVSGGKSLVPEQAASTAGYREFS